MKASKASLVLALGLLLALPLAVSAQQTTAQLLFPFYIGSNVSFTGYAITNFSTGTAQLTVEGFGNDGTTIDFPDNPSSQTLGSENQLARLGAELFGADLFSDQDGWIRMTSATPELASFFQFGNGMTGAQTMLDGGIAVTAPSQTLFFTRVYEGPATFPSFGLTGPQDASTFLSIANPSDEAITLTLNIINPQAQNIAPAATIALPALGRVFDDISTLFGQTIQTDDAFVRVDATGDGAVGFLLIVLEDSILGLSAVEPSGATTLYSAQLANGGDENGRIFTSVNLVNTGLDPAPIVISAVNNQGQEFTVSPVFTINPGANFRRSVDQLFPGISNPSSDILVTGSMIVRTLGGGGLVGDVIFGDPGDEDTGTAQKIDYVAALPMQAVRFTRAIFSQVANGQLAPNDASLDLFTGLAIQNANDDTASIMIRVFDPSGTLIGDTTISLGANERLDSTVEVLVPASVDLIGGFIEIESDQPLVAQILFGNGTLDYMSAVPPAIIE